MLIAGLNQIYPKIVDQVNNSSISNGTNPDQKPNSNTNTSYLIDSTAESRNTPSLASDLLTNSLSNSASSDTIDVKEDLAYASPMKKILELITNNNKPIIVLNDSENATNDIQPQPQLQQPQSSQHQSVSIRNANSHSYYKEYQQPNLQHQQLTNEDQQSSLPPTMGSSNGQHWAIDSNGAIQPYMKLEQQQISSSSMYPYANYYISSNNLQNNQQRFQQYPQQYYQQQPQMSPYNDDQDRSQTYIIDPTSGQLFQSNNINMMRHYPENFIPINRHQQMISSSNQLYEPTTKHMKAQNLPQQSNQDSSPITPVFLSSYIPEVSIPQLKTKSEAQIKNQDSIQQIQKSQNQDQQQQQDKQQRQDSRNQKDKPESKEDESQETSRKKVVDSKQNTSTQTTSPPEQSSIDKSDNDDNIDSDDFPDTNVDNQGPMSSNSVSDDEDENPSNDNQSNGGSLVYEDKYDSDNPSASRNSLRSVESGQPKESKDSASDMKASSSEKNGLVGVGLNNDCLQCICRASSGCDTQLRCITRGTKELRCGPFQLSEDYWTKGGSITDEVSNFIGFESCANDIDCAAETVTNYLTRYIKDCDGDNVVTCIDYARLHRLKPDECEDTEKLMNDPESYWEKFQKCAETYNKTMNFEDEEGFK